MSSNDLPLPAQDGDTRRQFLHTTALAGAAAMTGCATNAAEAAQYVKCINREGWEI
jgi:nitrous oxide reductase